jgi:hypothetical protein
LRSVHGKANNKGDVQPTPCIFLDIAASSAVTGEIAPEEKKPGKPYVDQGPSVFRANSLSKAKATANRASEPLMVNTPNQGIARTIENVVVHSAPKISVSHPVKKEAGQRFSCFTVRHCIRYTQNSIGTERANNKIPTLSASNPQTD